MDRLERLEDKVDKLKEDISELKTDFKVHTALIQEHVAGDKKIIIELQPMLEHYRFEKEKKEIFYKRAKLGSQLAAILSVSVMVIGKILSLI